MTKIPKGRLVKGPYKPICRDCAIFFSISVTLLITVFFWGQICAIHQCVKPLKLGKDWSSPSKGRSKDDFKDGLYGDFREWS